MQRVCLDWLCSLNKGFFTKMINKKIRISSSLLRRKHDEFQQQKNLSLNFMIVQQVANNEIMANTRIVKKHSYQLSQIQNGKIELKLMYNDDLYTPKTKSGNGKQLADQYHIKFRFVLSINRVYIHSHLQQNHLFAFMSDQMVRLFQIDAKRMELDLVDLFPWLTGVHVLHGQIEQLPKQIKDLLMEAQNSEEQEFKESHQINGTDDSDNSQTRMDPKSPQTKNQMMRSRRKPQGRKQRRNDEEESQFSEFSSGRNSLKHKGKISKNPGYPTKNFLPNFKVPHFEYLDQKLGSQFVDSIPFAKNLRHKSGISLSDYESLYKISQFQQTFILFFAQKVLFRDLMLSRSTLAAKLIHIKKLHVFQRAFIKKEFTRIN